jgi:hypothetical protein
MGTIFLQEPDPRLFFFADFLVIAKLSRSCRARICDKSLVRSFTSFLNCPSFGAALHCAQFVTKAWYSHFLLFQT